MCGLVGLISKNTYGFHREHQEIFTTLLFTDMLRGADSTGIFLVDSSGDVVVAKDAVHSVDFIRSKEYEEVQRRAFKNGMALIGHNRKATRGDVTDVNAHPFNVDNNIILVHNGTMVGDHKKHAQVEVDSHAIAHLIHEKGDVSKALSSFYGAYALMWYDVEKATVNMVRNDQRPLWWMETATAWVWASTPDMLEFARHRHTLKLLTEPTELPEHTHQIFTLNPDKSWSVENEKVEIKRAYDSSSNITDYSDWPYGGSMGGGYSHRGASFRGGRSYEQWAEEEWGIKGDGTDANAGHRPLQQQPQTAILQVLPSPNTNVVAIDREPVEPALLSQREKVLAKTSNNVIPYGEYQGRIVNKSAYPWGKSVSVVPFDYAYANDRDGSTGYYLYAIPVDGDPVIFRQWFSGKVMAEERMLQIASGGYLYEFTCGRKYWASLSENVNDTSARNIRDDHPGFVVIQSQECKLLQRSQFSETSH